MQILRQHAERCYPAAVKHSTDIVNHVDIALGSQAEVEVQLEIAKRVGFLVSHEYDRGHAMVEEVGQLTPTTYHLPPTTYHLPSTYHLA